MLKYLILIILAGIIYSFVKKSVKKKFHSGSHGSHHSHHSHLDIDDIFESDDDGDGGGFFDSDSGGDD